MTCAVFRVRGSVRSNAWRVGLAARRSSAAVTPRAAPVQPAVEVLPERSVENRVPSRSTSGRAEGLGGWETQGNVTCCAGCGTMSPVANATLGFKRSGGQLRPARPGPNASETILDRSGRGLQALSTRPTYIHGTALQRTWIK